jgi:hypothetical protein
MSNIYQISIINHNWEFFTKLVQTSSTKKKTSNKNKEKLTRTQVAAHVDIFIDKISMP